MPRKLGKTVATNKNKDVKTRNWLLIVYPESAPADWRQVIDDLHVRWVESPLHDKDVKEETDEEQKKAHWHILLMFDSTKSFSQVLEIAKSVSAPMPKPCQSPTGSVRYFIHMDNPEKYQYSRDDIVAHGAVDVGAYLAPTTVDRHSIIMEIIKYIKEEEITEFADLVDTAIEQGNTSWFTVLCDNSTIFINTYLSSRRNAKKREAAEPFADGYHVNMETGEMSEI